MNHNTPGTHCSGHFNLGLFHIVFETLGIAAEQLGGCKNNFDAAPIALKACTGLARRDTAYAEGAVDFGYLVGGGGKVMATKKPWSVPDCCPDCLHVPDCLHRLSDAQHCGSAVDR